MMYKILLFLFLAILLSNCESPSKEEQLARQVVQSLDKDLQAQLDLATALCLLEKSENKNIGYKSMQEIDADVKRLTQSLRNLPVFDDLTESYKETAISYADQLDQIYKRIRPVLKDYKPFVDGSNGPKDQSLTWMMLFEVVLEAFEDEDEFWQFVGTSIKFTAKTRYIRENYQAKLDQNINKAIEKIEKAELSSTQLAEVKAKISTKLSKKAQDRPNNCIRNVQASVEEKLFKRIHVEDIKVQTEPTLKPVAPTPPPTQKPLEESEPSGPQDGADLNAAQGAEFWAEEEAYAKQSQENNDLSIYHTRASSEMKALSNATFYASNATDGRLDTWWSPASAENCWLEIDFPGPRTINEIEILAASIRSNYSLPNGTYIGNLYDKNLRIRTLRLEFSDGTSEDIVLQDLPRPQKIRLQRNINTQWIKLRPQSYYSASRWDDVCIGEVKFYKN